VLRFVKLYFVTLKISFETSSGHITTIYRILQQTFKQVSLPTTILSMLHKKKSLFVLRIAWTTRTVSE